MHQNHNNEDKLRLSELSELTAGFSKVGWEMLIQRMNSKEVLKTDLTSFLLFRQILEMGDALSVLIKSGCINASKPLVRSVLEYYFQLAYLFKDDEKRKALQFLYHYEMRLREYYEKLAFPEKGGSFFEKLKKDKHLKDDDIPDSQKKVYIENIKKIDLVLNEDDNIDIAKEYTRVQGKKKNQKTGKNGKVSLWYELFDGPTSIEGISMVLEEAALYQFIYRSCSSYAHGEDIVHANLEENDGTTFKVSELRDLRQLSIVTNNILLLIDHSCMLFLNNKIDDKRFFAERFLPFVLEKQKQTKKNNDIV